MTITAFGSLLLPLALCVFLFRRTWLLPLLPVAAVLQSPSVINLSWLGGELGATPFLVVAGLVCLDLIRSLGRVGWVAPAERDMRRLSQLLLVFLGVAVASALLLPWAFADLSVIAPMDKAGVESSRVPLAWSLSNLAQVVNVVLLAGVVLRVIQVRGEPGLARRMLIGMALALLASALIGLQQRLGWNGLVPMGAEFWASNPSYAQNYMSWAGAVPRVSWPLVDAAYASSWFAAAFGGFVALFLAGMRTNLALLGVLLSLFALGNTLGEAGALAVVVYSLLAAGVALVVVWRVPGWRSALLYRLVLASVVAACLLLAMHLVARHYQFADAVGSALAGVLERWNSSLLGPSRTEADAHALWLLGQSFGLGVGMGSNRASSFLTTLLSNTGVLGFLLFFAAFAYQLRALARRALAEADAPSMFFLGGSVSVLISMVIAIPDQNWPVLWVMLIGGLACLRERPSEVGRMSPGVLRPVVDPVPAPAQSSPVRARVQRPA